MSTLTIARARRAAEAVQVHESCACQDGVDMGGYAGRYGWNCSACHRELEAWAPESDDDGDANPDDDAPADDAPAFVHLCLCHYEPVCPVCGTHEWAWPTDEYAWMRDNACESCGSLVR